MFFLLIDKDFEIKKKGGCNDRKQRTPLGMETAGDSW